MSATATLAAPMAAESDRPSDGADFITLAEASRVSRLHETTLLRLALAGDVRYRTRGRRTLFHADDVRRVAS